MTVTVWDLRQQLPEGITETIVAYAHAGDRQRTQVCCPRCPRVLMVHEHVGRTVETMVGPGAPARPSFSCRSCRGGCYSLDDVLDVMAGCTQLEGQQAVVQLVTAVL